LAVIPPKGNYFVKNTGRKWMMAKIESENEHQMSSISESLGKAIILKAT
jgi:hypothetical protein